MIKQLLKDNPYKEMHGGPCVKALDKALADCHVQRQAYHGRSFIGNHVNKMLMVGRIQFTIFSCKYCKVSKLNVRKISGTVSILN